MTQCTTLLVNSYQKNIRFSLIRFTNSFVVLKSESMLILSIDSRTWKIYLMS